MKKKIKKKNYLIYNFIIILVFIFLLIIIIVFLFFNNENTLLKEAFCEGEGLYYDEEEKLCWILNLTKSEQIPWSQRFYLGPRWDGKAYYWDIGVNESMNPAFKFCNNLEFEGYNDWKLPTRKNFENKTCKNYFTTEKGFIGCSGSFWWTEEQIDHSLAWRVHLDKGIFEDVIITNKYFVTCVRKKN